MSVFYYFYCSLSLFQGELEKLNQSTDDINRWETELEVGWSCSKLGLLCAWVLWGWCLAMFQFVREHTFKLFSVQLLCLELLPLKLYTVTMQLLRFNLLGQGFSNFLGSKSPPSKSMEMSLFVYNYTLTLEWCTLFYSITASIGN